MVRVLIAVSSVGLGHIARSRPLGLLLQQVYGFNVEYLAPPPTDAYLKSYGISPLTVSAELRSLSTIVDEYYSRKGTGRIGLGMILKEYNIIKENRKVVDANIDYDDYDVVVADESWELLDSDKFLKRTGAKKVFMTDFLKYPYTKLRDIIVAALFNRFLWRRLKYFDLILFVGFPEKMVIRSSDSLRIEATGPIPPMLETEVLEDGKAKSMVGSRAHAILVSLGGTSAGIDIMKTICMQMDSGKYDVYIASGASISIDKIGNCIAINEKLKFKIPVIIRAFDTIISLSGLSSLAASIAEGIPTITIPLPQHFEQEENAIIATRKYNWITSIRHNEYGKIREIIEKHRKKRALGDKSLYKNQAKTIQAIKSIVK